MTTRGKLCPQSRYDAVVVHVQTMVVVVRSGPVCSTSAPSKRVEVAHVVGLSGKEANLKICDVAEPNLGFVGAPHAKMDLLVDPDN